MLFADTTWKVLAVTRACFLEAHALSSNLISARYRARAEAHQCKRTIAKTKKDKLEIDQCVPSA